MKILFIDNTYEFGGAIVSLSYIVRGLRKHGVNISLMTAQPVNRIEELFPGIRTFHRAHFPTFNHRYRFYKWQSKIPNYSLRKAVRLLFSALEIAGGLVLTLRTIALILRCRPDLIHLNNCLDQWQSLLAAIITRIPCVVHQRCFPSPSRTMFFCSRHSKFIITISNAIKQDLVSLGICEHKIKTIYNSIDISETTSCEANRDKISSHLGFDGYPSCAIFGRITRWKGQHVFIKAVALAKKTIPNLRALIIGGPPQGVSNYLGELHDLVDDLSLGEIVTFTGYRPDVRDLYIAVDIIVHASLEPEPFGRTIIEGMAAGKPVIATAMGGPLEIIEQGKNGFLVPPNDPEQLAKLMVELLADSMKQCTIGQNAKRKIEQVFSVEAQAQILWDLYLDVMGQKP